MLEIKLELELKLEPEPKVELEHKLKPETNPETELVPKPKAKLESALEPKPEPELDPELEPEPEPEPVLDRTWVANVLRTFMQITSTFPLFARECESIRTSIPGLRDRSVLPCSSTAQQPAILYCSIE
ncbi:unnamed protein product [Bursaphelenchus okinawaensis]|uniref:Uncharacterized protein n=1 Tax=Bursaphelenchus okinawaensis TaxID=465554 RepID=A0A811LE88_9BILA|nr:unnamed protein product [Bursaphelenchus okinawaensis]CAG9121605.1 unnamed protein product [Bursaphelenchus okinawaensis]